MARRLRQVIDLYATGKVVTLRDGSPVWVQPLNPFEQDTARNEAQIAKARLTLAIKEYGSAEQAKVRMYFFENGRDIAVHKLVDAKVALALPKVLDSLRSDPDWAERIQILDRGLEDTAKPAEPAEEELINKLATEFSTEVANRLSSEREYYELTYAASTEEELWELYLEWYLDRRANELMLAEFRMYQVYFGVRDCEGTDHGEGTWTHENCGGHETRLFDRPEEVRQAPEALQATLMDALDDLELSLREAKNSDRQGSSFDSSPLPSAAAESTASTPEEIPVAPPGSSWSPSPTPSRSSAGAS